MNLNFRWLINLFNYDDTYDWIDLDDLLYYELNLNIIIDINYIYIYWWMKFLGNDYL